MSESQSPETQAALRRIDLYAAGVCREFGLEVPKEWHLIYGEMADRLAASVEKMNRSIEAFGRAWVKAFGRIQVTPAQQSSLRQAPSSNAQGSAT